MWSSTAIKLLIENRSNFEVEFNKNKNKYKIWEKISEKLCESGIVVSGQNCGVKFKNIMATFKDNVQRANTSGESGISWNIIP